jgi:carbamoyl-phosphate synthase small subunit
VKGKTVPAKLILEDGSEFLGLSHAHHGSAAGEVVFTTGMTGYPQSLTDPSFKGQILVNTFPMIGNYGMPGNAIDEYGIPLFFESDRAQVSGFVVSEYCDDASHYANQLSLGDWLKQQKVPFISGIDTRALTERLRSRGVMRGKIVIDGSTDPSFSSGDVKNPVSLVSCKEIKTYVPALKAEDGKDYSKSAEYRPAQKGKGLRIALYDCGVKNNILRCFLARGATVIRLPWNAPLEGQDYDGLFISNGPGDPKDCAETVAQIKLALTGTKPIFGICLGNQLLGLAAGGDTYKLPFGHRSQNQPCVEVGTKRSYITSQNHGYAVRAESLPSGWEPWFLNGNDSTNEGIRHSAKPFFSVQFHPEGCPGPRDTEFLFDLFLDKVRAVKEGK